MGVIHRRSIHTEEKAKDVAAAAASIPCRSSYFALGWFEEWDELQRDKLKKMCKIASAARIESILSPKQQWRPLTYLLYKSFSYGVKSCYKKVEASTPVYLSEEQEVSYNFFEPENELLNDLLIVLRLWNKKLIH